MVNKLLALMRSDLFLYLIVGGLATIVEWTGFWIFFDMLHIQYLLATALAFVFSTFANWVFGRLLVFRGKQNQSLLKELASIYLTSLGGLVLNLIIMYVMVDFIGIWEMLAKITATVLVFSYNYLIRKKVIYKK
jgi:dolichol-phosphate mannosyltransferase